MQFSDTTNKNGIIQVGEQLCSLGDGGISNDATLLKQFTSHCNRSYLEVWQAGIEANRHIKADDFNYLDYPDAPITMIVSQQDYTIPVAVTGANVASFLRLNGVYFTVNGQRIYLSVMGDDEPLTSTAGEPTKYRLNGKSIWFNCPLDAATLTKYSSVFHVEFQRVPDAFTSADTTQQPGILETYHDLIPLGASSWHLLPTNPVLATQYEQRFLVRLEQFKTAVANLDDNIPRRITTMPVNHR